MILVRLVLALAMGAAILSRAALEPGNVRRGPVKVSGHSLADSGGPFLGLGASYFTALWRCKFDRPRMHSDLAFLSKQGFNYIRILSMVGWYSAWDGLEIAPVSYTSRAGKRVTAWDDYWDQLRSLIDIAFDRYGLRTQITLFADAQLMPEKAARIEHMRRILAEVLPGREHKVLLLEVANEAWQNGFSGAQGVAALREFAKYLNDRTRIPVAITSNHEGSFEETYQGSAADLATWHFSRDRRTDGGWKPVYDCWDYGIRKGCPPTVSNEPIGPGSSVDAERDPIRLVMAAAFAYTAGLPAYVFPCEAGVFGTTRFEGTPGIDRYGALMKLLPSDLPNWKRNDGKESDAVFTVFAAGQANRYWPEVEISADGCVRNIGARNGRRFISVPIGIREGGLTVQARGRTDFRVFDPLTGKELARHRLQSDERVTLPKGPGGLILIGTVADSARGN
jgi:hypothetical protein